MRFVVTINQALDVQKVKTAFLLEKNAIFWPQGHSAVHLSVDIVSLLFSSAKGTIK